MLIEPTKAISDWELDYNLGCAVRLIVDAQLTGKNAPLRKAIECLEAEIEHNQNREREKFKMFARYLSENPQAIEDKLCRDGHSDE